MSDILLKKFDKFRINTDIIPSYEQ